MIFRRRATSAPAGPQRGPGGGRVRAKPKRRRFQRRRMGTGEAIFWGSLSGVIVALLEHYLSHTSWAVSVLVAVVIAIISTAFNIWLERRRRRKELAEQRRTKRR